MTASAQELNSRQTISWRHGDTKS